MTIEEIRFVCEQALRPLVNRGKLVCDEFECEPERTYFCHKCGYSQYIHLCKQIAEAE